MDGLWKCLLANHPIFTIEEVSLALKMEKNDTLELLAYHLHKEHIVSICKGLYYTISRGADPNTYPYDPYLIAGKMAPDAILAYSTTLGFHGKLHSLPRHFIYISRTKEMPPLVFAGFTFEGMQTFTFSDLGDEFKEYLGCKVADVENVDYLGCKLRVTTLERTLVDVLHKPTLMDSWEEIWQSLESMGLLNFQQIYAYSRILFNETTCMRVAFFLDQERERLRLTEEELERFDRFRPETPVYLDPNKKEPDQLISRWNLIVPKSLVQKTWGGPYFNFIKTWIFPLLQDI